MKTIQLYLLFFKNKATVEWSTGFPDCSDIPCQCDKKPCKCKTCQCDRCTGKIKVVRQKNFQLPEQFKLSGMNRFEYTKPTLLVNKRGPKMEDFATLITMRPERQPGVLLPVLKHETAQDDTADYFVPELHYHELKSL